VVTEVCQYKAEERLERDIVIPPSLVGYGENLYTLGRAVEVVWLDATMWLKKRTPRHVGFRMDSCHANTLWRRLLKELLFLVLLQML
jgi:hypothetical protein